jgi:hypothetical protein
MSDFRTRYLHEAVKYVGVPYEHGGQSVLGLDCSGLIVEILRDLGFRVHDMTAHELFEQLFNQPQACHAGSIEGCFLTEQDSDNQIRIVHSALFLSDDTIIHSTERYGRVLIQSIERFTLDRGANYIRSWLDMCALMSHWVDSDPMSIGIYRSFAV